MATLPNNVINQPSGQLSGLSRQLVLNRLIDETVALQAIEQARKESKIGRAHV